MELEKLETELSILSGEFEEEKKIKKLAKKNVELQEVRETRQKLSDKEKEISASIEKLQNQKIEVAGEKRNQKRKFNTTNYLRLLASERNYSEPRWFSLSDIQRKNWTLKENANPELLEVINDGSISLKEFDNAAD